MQLMVRRRKGITAGQIVAFAVLFAIFAIATAVGNAVQSLGVWTSTALVVCFIAAVILYKRGQKKRKLEYLMGKYGDATIVDHVFNHRYWQGQTADQLTDSLGSPHGVDRKLLKTMKREVWKYNPRGVNRYALRITLDNDIVSNWDHKQ